MFRSILIIAISGVVFVAFPAYAPNAMDTMSSNGNQTIGFIQGLYHGFQIPWSILMIYSPDFTPLSFQTQTLCLFEPAYKNHGMYFSGWILGILLLISSHLKSLKK